MVGGVLNNECPLGVQLMLFGCLKPLCVTGAINDSCHCKSIHSFMLVVQDVSP